MTVLNITPTSGGERLDPDLARLLSMEIERAVGPVRKAGASVPNAKGVAFDVATIAVAVLSSQAMVALVGVLKSYFERDRGLEIEVGGDGWNVRLKSADARRMSAFDLVGLIERAIAGNRGETGDAPGSPGRV